MGGEPSADSTHAGVCCSCAYKGRDGRASLKTWRSTALDRTGKKGAVAQRMMECPLRLCSPH